MLRSWSNVLNTTVLTFFTYPQHNPLVEVCERPHGHLIHAVGQLTPVGASKGKLAPGEGSGKVCRAEPRWGPPEVR